MAEAEPPSEVRRQIERCLLAYARGVDRLDEELLVSAFHPGAELEGYGATAVTIEATVTPIIEGLRAGFRATQHRLSNTSIDMRDDDALVETYVLAFHVRPSDDGPDRLYTFNGRYIDRFTEVDREWRIAHRRLRHDWTKVDDIDHVIRGDWIHSARDRTDAVYD